MTRIDIALLRTLLRYEPETGKLFWLERGASLFEDGEGRYTASRSCRIWNGRYAGTEAFTASDVNGYRRGSVLNCGLLAHRVAWAIFHGAWPIDKLDHIDRDPSNNRIVNLRECTQAQNTLNRKGNSTGRKTSKYKGVYWQRDIARWRARFREEYLGTFLSEQDAAAAYDRVASAHDSAFAHINLSVGG